MSYMNVVPCSAGCMNSTEDQDDRAQVWIIHSRVHAGCTLVLQFQCRGSKAIPADSQALLMGTGTPYPPCHSCATVTTFWL